MPDNGTMVDMQGCIEECMNCHGACADTMAYCLQEGGAHADASHITLLLDCAEICQTSANFMLRGSQHHATTCGACAKICDACADACERFGEDEQMKLCAEACRSCADSCREMAGM